MNEEIDHESDDVSEEQIAEETQKNTALPKMVSNAGRMMVGTLVSRVLGLVREMLAAALFGATGALDAFFVAYTLANLARQLLAEGALSASFVPVFSRTLASDGQERAHKLANQALTIIIIGCSAVIIIGILLAPQFVSIIAPGFDGGQKELAVSLTRVMFPFLMLVSVGALAMGVLNSVGCYFIPAIAPALSNAAYILFLLATYRHLSVWNLAFAVLIGGLCHMGLQVFWCSKLEMRLSPSVPNRNDNELKTMMALFLPYAAGLSLNQLNPVISRMLGSYLAEGSISVLTYADRVLQLPLGLFVIAISQAVLPLLARQDPDNTGGFRDFVRDAMRFNLFVIIPVAAGLAILSPEAVHILFFRGAFSEWAWEATSVALSLYALGLPGMASNTVIMRAIYARKMPRAAMTVTGFTVLVNLSVSLLLMPALGYAGLAAASAAAFTAASTFAAFLLSRNLKEKLHIFEAEWLIKIASSAAVMVLLLALMKLNFPYPQEGTVAARVLWLGSAVVLGGLSYAAATLVLKCSEWKWILDAVKRKSSKKKEA